LGKIDGEENATVCEQGMGRKNWGVLRKKSTKETDDRERNQGRYNVWGSGWKREGKLISHYPE